MKATEKDEIKFHILFNMIREHLNVPLNIACYGLCSDSMMNYIETGERLPDYRMRNRIMARLGVSSEEYEDFVQYDEYERWERCQKLIDAVEQKKQDLAEHILNELLTDADIDNKIEYQFLMDMKGRILEMEGTVWDEIARVYEEAVELSMPDFDNIDWNRYIFSPEEFYILVRWLMAKTRYAADGNRAYICSSYEKICGNIQRNLKQAYASAKVYPMAVYGWYLAVDVMDAVDDETVIKIWTNSCGALDSLRNAGRAYYLKELLQLRQVIRGQIVKRKLITNNEGELKIYEHDWLNSFNKLYEKYAVDADINYSGYIYINSEVYCISDIISSRRRIYGLSRKELAEGVCTERTIIRIEKKQVKPQQYVIEGLFKKLGVVSDYLRAEILTNDYATLELYSDYKHAMNDADYKRADLIEKKLHTILDLGYPENRQVMANMTNNRKIRTGEIDRERYFQNMKNIIGMTLPGEFQCSPEDYLSDMEVTILKNIAFESDVEEYKNDLVDKCEKYYKKHIKNHASLYEFIMGTVASRYGDQGKYAASNEIAGFIIEEATKLFRPHAIHRNLFCITWNNAMSTGNYYESSYLDALKNCKAIATFCKDFYTASFYDKRINGFINNEDWTL